MKIISATTRVTIGLICLGVSVWTMAFLLGMFPDCQEAVIRGRASLSENLALHCSLLASRNDRRTMQSSLDGLIRQNQEVQSAAIRRSNGELLITVGPHTENWNLLPGNQSTATQMRVPILSGNSLWGMIEVCFRDQQAAGTWTGAHPLLALGVFTAAATYLLYFLYLRKMLQHLDPSHVIPRRVRETLDTITDGLLVLDPNKRILLANRAFADSLGTSSEELTGCNASDLPFDIGEKQQMIEGFPWDRAMSQGTRQIGDLLTIRGKNNQRSVLKVSSAPIYGDDGRQRGAFTSFADVTSFEQNRVELRQMLDALSFSRDEIQRQNVSLERLAAHDPLTNCLNRRALFSDFESHWSAAARHNHPISCIMVDLDHFKAINDTHGHQVGDIVLQKAAEQIRNGRRPSDLICRYGGEEFCIMLLHTDLDAAMIVAENIRVAIETTDFNGVSVTASLGVTSRGLGATNPQTLIDQADKCLYVAKRGGRNRVVRFDQANEEIAAVEKAAAITSTSNDAQSAVAEEDRDPVIPFHAVTALVSALAYRDQATADHARRVADLCVAAARRLMPVSQCYELEIASLLHDIGKIGVPDAILLKPGKLTDEEWQVMNSHERIGAEIVHSTFSSPTLAEIIRTYRAWFGGNPRRPELPTGDDIPLAARILAIADAYDSMTSHTSYRKALSREQAFTELRRCSIRQFDPDLVERFIDSVISREGTQPQASADMPRFAALSLGTQIERLAQALDNNDKGSIAALAGRLKQSADKCEAADIANVAARLHEAASEDVEVKQLVQLTVELLDLCRATQRAYLNDAANPAGLTGFEACRGPSPQFGGRNLKQVESGEELTHA